MSEIDNNDINTKVNNLIDLGPYFSKQNNAKNCVYFSDIPESCKNEPCVLGVDEAGRGPVLGPMSYGIAFCPLAQVECLQKLGCADSKQLTEEKRDIIFNNMHVEAYAKESIGWAVELISPNVISSNMLRRTKNSLNEVSMDSAIGLINKAIDLGVNIAEVYVDTVGPPEKYQEKLLKIFPDFLITVAKKADSTYPIVSAASICAKVSRDHALRMWKFPEGIDSNHKLFGSGYPGDPNTKSFLQENIEPVFGFPRLVRFSWSTSINALNGKAYNVIFDEEAGKENTKYSYNGVSITSFFSKSKNQPKKLRSKHTFFRQRYLDNVSDL